MINRILNGAFWLLASTGFLSILRLIVIFVLARAITPLEFGQAEAAIVVMSLFLIFTGFGIGTAIVQRQHLQPHFIRTGFTLICLLGILMAGLMWSMAATIAGLLQMEGLVPILQVMAIGIPINNASRVAGSLARRELMFRSLGGIQLFSYVIGYGIIGVSLALLEFGVWAIIAAHLSQEITNSGLLLIIHPHPKCPLLDPTACKEFFVWGGAFMPSRLSLKLGSEGDSLVVGRWLGEESLGLYGRAHQLSGVPLTLLNPILDKVLFPAMAKVQHNVIRLALAYERSMALAAVLVWPVCGAFFLVAPEFIQVLLGSKWVDVTVPLQLLTLSLFARTGYRISDALILATGSIYKRAWRQVLYAIFVIGGAFVGRLWGITGVALGVLGALILSFFLMVQLSLALTQMTWKRLGASCLPAFRLTVAIFAEVGLAVLALRWFAIHPLTILIATMALVGLNGILLVIFRPLSLLGKDGIWLLETLNNYVPQTFDQRSWTASLKTMWMRLRKDTH